ncbi:hypothetical protein Pyn_40908 [Prunus yedoensis var. nudiflora]|uniref:GST C-terminal domain-containing protein n=1 Tax=Prunus yedoensis var. nudiflora TaxID=2094558 RepID=A0A314UE65_PRUYE|nr:hypothetical protein Pyn_40908 [Prunus yedoensis var. nudiflora]
MVRLRCEMQVYESGKRTRRTKGEEHEAAKREFLECIRLLEEEPGDKPYFGGENLGFVDVALIPTYSWFYMREKFGNFSVECHDPYVEGSTQQLWGQPRGSIYEGQAPQEKLKAQPVGWIMLDLLAHMSRFKVDSSW